MTMSVMILPPALMYHNGKFGIHRAPISVFQNPSMGMQLNIEMNTRAILQAQIAVIMTIMSDLDLTATRG